jgi:YD repeat-containing protein
MNTDREKCGLRGPVKFVRVGDAPCEGRDGENFDKPWRGHTLAFDREGRLVEQVYHNPEGSELRTVNEYSSPGRLLATRIYTSGVLRSEVSYVYDDLGRLAAEQCTGRAGVVTTPVTYAYNAGGRKIKVEEFDFSADGIEADSFVGIGGGISVRAGALKRVETRYDDSGEAAEFRVINAAGALVTRVEIARDGRGNPLEEVRYAGDVSAFGSCAPGPCPTEEDMAALSEEQKAEVMAEVARLFPPGGVMSRQSHAYDAEGRLIETRSTVMGEESGRQTFAYNGAGDRSEEASYDGAGRLVYRAVYGREYDAHGNWTKEIVSAAASWDPNPGQVKPRHVTHREIAYW